MNDISTEKAPGSVNVKTVFDEILVKHIRRLLEIDTIASSLAFNLSTVACLLLLVERENEIKNFPQSPPERYTRETFLDDLSDVGLDIDDTLMVSFQGLAQHGYVEIDQSNHYNAQISAFALVNFLDNLFPGMKGMNLVGYILQMIDEVSSKRKDLKTAIEQFDTTLQSKGIPLSKQQVQTEEKKSLTSQPQSRVDQKAAKQISDDLKKAYIHKLQRLRDGTASGSTRTGGSQPNVSVKEIFPRGPSEDEIRAQAAEQAAKEAEAKALIEVQKKAEQEEAERQAREAEEKAAAIAAQEAAIAAREAEIRAKEAEFAAREAEQKEKEAQEGPEQPEPHSAPDFGNIEDKIAAFEETLATSCPVCNTGKVLSGTTEKGQEYYSCNNKNCGFISWGKPYPFACPLCKNPFLIETSLGEGKTGLKCPRATCSFRQDHLGPPQVDGGASPVKKKKLVRRVRRKR